MRVVVVGATRNFFKVGHATFRSLGRTRPDVKLRLAIPDIVDARRAVGEMPVELRSWDPSAPTSLRSALKDCTAMLLVPPIDKRVPVAELCIHAAQESGIQYILCLGVQHPAGVATMGSEAEQVRDMLAESGVPYDVLRSPMFLENLLYQVLSISDRYEFQYPVRPEAKFSYVTCSDLSEIFARLLTETTPQLSSDDYWTAADTLSCFELAELLSHAIGATIRFRTCTGEEFVRTLVQKGMSTHAGSAVMELWDLIGQGVDPTPTEVLAHALGRTPTTAAQWVFEHRCCFNSKTWEECPHPKPPRSHLY